jgi:hypothetical protein
MKDIYGIDMSGGSSRLPLWSFLETLVSRVNVAVDENVGRHTIRNCRFVLFLCNALIFAVETAKIYVHGFQELTRTSPR